VGLAACFAISALAACAPSEGANIIGGPGHRDGRFRKPRGIAISGDGRIFVVDKTGRIQRFSPEGIFERGWETPKHDNGCPIGMVFDRRGRLLVADTHEHRVLVYSPDGELIHQWGREGTGPGEFRYPVGIAVGPNGAVFVSEYGGNDRIQVFDEEGTYLRQWGEYGSEPGQFARPEGIAIAADGIVYVADAANHRIQVFDEDGRLVRMWGRPGAGAGELAYPYDVDLLPDGRVLVTEFGNHRLQVFDAEGRSLAIIGGPGAGPGQLGDPWSSARAADGRVWVCEGRNHRVQAFRIPE
jgi:DNA-binding beta-propeller fold protein YncE